MAAKGSVLCVGSVLISTKTLTRFSQMQSVTSITTGEGREGQLASGTLLLLPCETQVSS